MENKNTVTITTQELQALLNTIGQIPTQYGAGLFQFFANKAQAAMPKNVEASSHIESEQALTSEQEHG